MRRTRLSLFYLAGYLLPTGLLLLVDPRTTLKLLFSTGSYDDAFPRVAGMLLLAIGIIIVQIIRHRVEVLYPTTLVVRALFLVGFLGLYWYTRDPLFLVIMGVVGLGFILTGTSYWLDRREKVGGRADGRTGGRMGGG
jgi:uncharacterized protein YjeT (DUF2065 family)